MQTLIRNSSTLERLGFGPFETEEVPPTVQVREWVREHDRYQVEIKHHYPSTPGRQLRYEIETYIFVPSGLGIDETSYPIDEFFRRTQNYTRLSVASGSLRDLARGRDSPLSLLERPIQGDGVSDADAIQILKLLCVVFQKALELQTPDRRESKKAGVTLIRELLVETETILDRHRALSATIANRGDELRQAYQLTAERMSLLADGALLRAYEFALRRLPRHSVIDELAAAIERENSHRMALNPTLVLRSDGANEEYLSRDSFLKKYVSSVLYLDSEHGREGATLEHLIYAAAAGIAMIFATAVTFYAHSAFGAYTLPVFFALVFSYMFKDRIKEIGRARLGGLLRDRLSDRKTQIHARKGVRGLGVIRETVRHVPLSKVPRKIIAGRRKNLSPFDETVLRYSKHVVLNAHALDELAELRAEIAGVTDILRYDLRPFLHRMDDPVEIRLCWENDRLQRVRCQKNYVVELVSAHRHSGSEAPEEVHSTTLVLNRKGIKRVEHG